jgi:hypothetical protein
LLIKDGRQVSIGRTYNDKRYHQASRIQSSRIISMKNHHLNNSKGIRIKANPPVQSQRVVSRDNSLIRKHNNNNMSSFQQSGHRRVVSNIDQIYNNIARYKQKNQKNLQVI